MHESLAIETLGDPLEDGPSKEVVGVLRARGYDVYSSNDCAYRVDRGVDVYPRSSSNAAIILGIEPFKFEGNDLPTISSHYQA